jgi:hypothetical protein
MTSRETYKQAMLSFGCGSSNELANYNKMYCKNAMASMRKMIASGEVHPDSPAASYVRGKCGGL